MLRHYSPPSAHVDAVLKFLLPTAFLHAAVGGTDTTGMF